MWSAPPTKISLPVPIKPVAGSELYKLFTAYDIQSNIQQKNLLQTLHFFPTTTIFIILDVVSGALCSSSVVLSIFCNLWKVHIQLLCTPHLHFPMCTPFLNKDLLAPCSSFACLMSFGLPFFVY